MALQPRDHERGVATAVAVAEAEAKLAPEAFCATPADQRYLELVGERPNGDRVVGAVGTGDRDAALVDEVAEPVGRVLRGTLGKPILRVQHELDRTVEQSRLRRLVECEAVNLVVAAAWTVERGTEPADLDWFHGVLLSHVGTGASSPCRGCSMPRLRGIEHAAMVTRGTAGEAHVRTV